MTRRGTRSGQRRLGERVVIHLLKGGIHHPVWCGAPYDAAEASYSADCATCRPCLQAVVDAGRKAGARLRKIDEWSRKTA